MTSEPPYNIMRKQHKEGVFQRKNTFYLRIGKHAVVPFVLYLHSAETFNDILFQTQELLAILRELLPLHLSSLEDDSGILSVRNLSTTKPQTFRGENVRFTYQFRPAASTGYSVMIKADQLAATFHPPPSAPSAPSHDAPASVSSSSSATTSSSSSGTSPPSALTPGSYYAFHITKYVLLVETVPLGAAEDSPGLSSISRFFAPASQSVPEPVNVGKRKRGTEDKEQLTRAHSDPIASSTAPSATVDAPATGGEPKTGKERAGGEGNSKTEAKGKTTKKKPANETLTSDSDASGAGTKPHKKRKEKFSHLRSSN